MLTLNGIEDAKARVGEELGVSEPFVVTQETIDAFAKVTEDFNFIHVDPEKAAQTPFGSTIAHGLLTLSLGPKFMYELLDFHGFGFGVNYGYNKVRFPAPVPVDSPLRMRATLSSVEDVSGGIQITIVQTFEVEGGSKPVCVAEHLVRLFGGS